LSQFWLSVAEREGVEHLNSWASAGGQNRHLPPLEIGNEKQKFVENVKSAV